METDKGAAKAAAGAFARPLILIADDNADAREMYALYLSMVGYMVAVARGGREAVKRARELRPDLIVMDLDMPDEALHP